MPQSRPTPSFLAVVFLDRPVVGPVILTCCHNMHCKMKCKVKIEINSGNLKKRRCGPLFLPLQGNNCNVSRPVATDIVVSFRINFIGLGLCHSENKDYLCTGYSFYSHSH